MSVLWDKILRDLHNSSGNTKAEFNDCFIIFARKHDVFTREYVAFIGMSLKPCSHVRSLLYRTLAIISCHFNRVFFMNLDLSQVDCVSSEGERRQKLAFEKLKST